MWVEQAIYGEVQGGHALRSASGDRSFAQSIASKLDLPDNAPPGVLWSPYISGFPSGDRYVLARTFADAGASRSGMVLTHALIMPLAELAGLRNLKALFRALITSTDQTVPPTGFNLEEDTDQPENSQDLISAANALTSRGSGPVVMLGMEGFEALVTSLWSNLWPEVRSTFSFRLSFGPTDVVESPSPILVCTPATLSARWLRYRVLSGESLVPASSSAGLLVGSVDSASLLGFAREIGADLRRLSDLPLLEHAHMLLSGEDELDNVLAAVRLIEKLSPVPLIGGDVKKAVATRLTAHIATATPRQILALRNLSLTGFPSVPDLWQEVESWFTSRYFALADDPPMMQIVSATTSRDTAVEAWLNVVGRGMTAAARVDSSELPNAVWRWIFKQPDLLDAIFELLPTEQPVELRIASATPEKMPPPLAETIVLKSLARKWSAMHGAVLSAIADPISAAHRQIAIDANEASTTGIKFALRLASSAQLLDCAVQLGDERLISLAVDAVLADPNIFMRSQCTEIAEQKIWEAALRRNGDLWRTPHDPFSARDAALKSLVEGSKVHLPLIEELARTPLADLCDSPLREQFLSDLKIAAGHEYLQATAAGWLKRAMESSPPFSPDLALKTAILSGTDLDKTLSALAPDITAGIRIIEALGGVDEQRFLAWFRALLSQGKALPISGMETLGRLVLARSWHRVVDEMVAKYRGNRFDVKPALRICASMLSLLMRWKLDISAPSVSEKWESFANVAAELYPSGPDHEELWSRAGGSNSDLPRIGSGRSIWLTVISQIRNGRGPSPTRLLREMQQDYRSNPDLSFIANDPDIAGYRR